jgi:hypothetical protein
MTGQGLEGAYLPGGEPKMRETTASLAILMFCTDPRMWMWLWEGSVLGYSTSPVKRRRAGWI